MTALLAVTGAQLMLVGVALAWGPAAFLGAALAVWAWMRHTDPRRIAARRRRGRGGFVR